MDYTDAARGRMFPSFKLDFKVHARVRSNPLGMKGCGEAGAIAALRRR